MFIALALTIISASEPGLSLADAVSLALGSEPGIAAARSVRDRAELAELRAELDRFRVSVDASLEGRVAESTFEPPLVREGAAALGDVTASLSVPIFSGFRVESAIERAARLSEAARSDVVSVERDTALAVARAYWAIRKLDLEVEVEQRAIERMVSAEAIARARLAAGLAPPIDESRLRARRLVRESSVADLRGASGEAKARLAVLLGVEEVASLVDPVVRAVSLVPADELVARARSGRPELAAARERVRAEEAALGIAESGWYPTLAAYGLARVGGDDVAAGADLQAGLRLSINLFDTLGTYTAVKDARYEQARVAAEAARIERAVEAEVRAALARVERFVALKEKLAAAEAIARSNVEINRRRYEDGDAQVFELLDSEVELLELEQRLAGLGAELTLASLELDASTGSVVGGSR